MTSDQSSSLISAAASFLEDRAVDHYLPNVSDPTTILTQSLALTTVASTNSATAQEHQRPFEQQSSHKWRSIGQGQCGTVFENVGTSVVLKNTLCNDPALQDWIWNDVLRCAQIGETLLEVGAIECRIPKVFAFNNEDSSFWEENKDCFLEMDAARPGWAMLAERILPLPQKIRHALIEKYCPENVRVAAYQSQANKDCLVRLYIGRRRAQGARRKQFFTLRNFGLTADMMEELKLPIKAYLDPMTEALAAMYFAAKVDARDVEFVLGCEPGHLNRYIPVSFGRIESIAKGSEILPKSVFQKRIVSVWCLDFNQVQDITMDDAGMRKAAEAFWLNDPYFPRPFDAELWPLFKSAYISFSATVIQRLAQKPDRNLPARFLQLIEDKYRS